MAEAERGTVGIVGLGTMGGALAHHLLAAGYRVVGTDPSEAMRTRFVADGGTLVASPAETLAATDVVLTCLPSVAALDEVVAGPEGLVAGARPGAVVLELSTFPVEDKRRCGDLLAAASVTLLDGAMSGTGDQAWRGDVVVYLSGDEACVERVLPVVRACSREHHVLGAFGNASRMKYLANLLVTIHNVAAAEAITLGIRAGLDPHVVHHVLGTGAGASRMLAVRGPAMADADYSNPGIAARTYLKDVEIITSFARSLDCPVPLFMVAGEYHVAAVAQGHGDDDTSSVAAVARRNAGLD
jgi:3-hydroxyisobutyrate dehydrogenase-like beta-hydroxyacid dehydrogenase